MSKNVLLITAGLFHPPFLGRLALHRALRQLDGFNFQHLPSLEKLPANLEQVSALVVYIHQARISRLALDRLENFVRDGGGLLAVHSATASFKQQLAYFDILGGRFTGHGAVDILQITNHNSQVFNGIADFVIRDELYLHETNPAIQVHFTAKHNRQEVPVVWTYHYGKGKVCYVLPGHTTGSMRHPAVQAILQRGLQWIC